MAEASAAGFTGAFLSAPEIFPGPLAFHVAWFKDFRAFAAGALIIRIGFGGPLLIIRNPQK